jgi:hypothetical protein
MTLVLAAAALAHVLVEIVADEPADSQQKRARALLEYSWAETVNRNKS